VAEWTLATSNQFRELNRAGETQGCCDPHEKLMGVVFDCERWGTQRCDRFAAATALHTPSIR
jgi:hypothetical protein